MASFSPGDRVVDPADPTKTAVVLDGPKLVAGTPFYLVMLASQEETFLAADDLKRREVDPHNPVAWLIARPLVNPDSLARVVTHLKLTSQLTDVVYSFSSTRTLFRVHQFKPVLKVIESPVSRLLLADEVGLGKTIEAGLVWSELDARSTMRRVLIVCPSGLRRKWQLEMQRRFDRDTELVDRHGMLHFIDRYAEQGDRTRLAAISSYSQLRHESVLDALSRRPPTFDLVIMDEAHAMRNAETRTHQLGELLAQNSDALLLLSATPVNLGSNDLFNLLRLLRPDEFNDPTMFQHQLEPNEFINQAASQLRSVFPPSAPDVLDTLTRVEKTSQGRAFLANPVYQDVVERLKSGAVTARHDVVALQHDITELNTLADVYTRTRKRDLKDQPAIRRARDQQVPVTPEESALHDLVLALVAQLKREVTGAAPGLAAVMPARQAASCLPVMRDYLKKLVGEGRITLDLSEGEEDDEDVVDDVSDRDVPVVVGSEVAATIDLIFDKLPNGDTKFDVFAQTLADLREEGSDRFLVFSFFRLTLGYLHRRLADLGYRVAQMHGGTPTRVRDDLIDSFRRGDLDVLLCSEVGSEGLDFEFCDVVVNYDLPWNPMRLEQRIGRIDRFGQKSPVVHIVNFEIPGTIDTEIFFRLYHRIGIFERSIGELEPILGPKVREVTRALASRELTFDEQRLLTEEVAQALVREQADLDAFEELKDHLVGADDWIDGALSEAREGRRYLTPEEVARYVDGFLRREASPARLDPPGNDAAIVPLTGSPALADHLRAYGRGLMTPSFGELIATIEAGSPIAVTFESDAAYGSRAEFLNVRHPLVRTITEFYRAPENALYNGGFVRVPHPDRRGWWVFFLFVLTATGMLARRSLVAVAYDTDSGAVDEDLGEEILAFLGGAGPSKIPERDIPMLDPEVARQAHEAVLGAVAARKAKLQEDLAKRNDALITSRQQSILQGLSVRRARLLELAERPDLDERIRRMRTAQIGNLEIASNARVADLEGRRGVTVGFRAVAGGLAEFVES